MTLTRRAMLKGLAAGAGGVAAFGGLDPLLRAAAAQGTADRYFVFCYFGGGWDILLSLDPRDPVEFNSGNVNETRIMPGYERLLSTQSGPFRDPATGILFGPHIGDLRLHAGKLCIVRGMSMETLTHEAGRRRFLTGKVPSGLLARGSSAATWLASRLGQNDPIPNLAVRVESYNKDQPKYATGLRVGAVPDLIRVLRPGEPSLNDAVDRQVDAFLREQAACTNPRRSTMWQLAEQSRLQAASFASQGLDQMFDFGANTQEMIALRDFYGMNGAGGAALSSPAAQAAIAARAIMGGVSRCVSIQVANGLDTHYEDDWTQDQGPRQEEGFAAVSRLVEDLERTEYPGGTGESWLDRTTILGFSEFCRTAMLNERGGRDHSLTNACFLLGAGVKGGQAIGASSNVGMNPAAIDLSTGLPDPGGEVPRPEHVLQTFFEDVGIGDAADLRVRGLDAIRRA